MKDDVAYINHYERIWLGTEDGRIYMLRIVDGKLQLVPENEPAKAEARAREDVLND